MTLRGKALPQPTNDGVNKAARRIPCDLAGTEAEWRGPPFPGPGCYWTTSSARRRSEGGSVNPRADAAFMLMDR